jgi:hypothetical protein
MGAGIVSLLATVRPDWNARRRQLIAASVLPIVTFVAALLGILLITIAEQGQGGRIEELAIFEVVKVGGGFTLLALVGGLMGAFLAGRRRG